MALNKNKADYVTVTAAGGIASTNAQAALEELDTEKAPLASPALTGTPTAPTPATSDNSTKVATTAYTRTREAGLQTQIDAKAPLASPALTGNPTAPTQSAGNDSTRIATTAFVQDAIGGGAQSKTQNGYTTLPGGVILQWGRITGIGNNNSGSVTFPVAFPNACFSVVNAESGSSTDGVAIFNLTTTSFAWDVDNPTSSTIYWMAIGH